ncbi:PAS domain-containing sensor histidine kinase [Dyadobacter sp. CY312]|uniref:sensor histidine kinase n=1 Tax=Dyadobacter sp. CY312 TaxID=2907303 RepID=UPI001F2474A6|nr:HAMP domain-containing sensor histidine kinase [Dyadobacter sp. CY312]MCE7039898.1 ATP-binding protein [Dyadobacter sp. CY312]
MRWSVKSKYILYILVLHLVLVLLVYKILFQDKILFIASEVFLLISVALSIKIYHDFMQPNEFVRSGIEAIKDKDFTIKFVPTGKGEVDSLIDVYNLMIDQLREERTKLNEQHFFLEKLIAASPISIIIFDFDEKIETLNAKAENQFGKNLKGKGLEETGVPLLADLKHLADGDSRIFKAEGIETFKVQRSHFMDQGFKRSFILIEELTAEMHESEKKAYGKVIRMMAHEVNNTLGATDSILQTTRNYLNTDEYSDLSDALRIASERNMRLTRFMRNFADVVRLPLPGLETIDLSKLVRDVCIFMQPFSLEKGVRIELNISENISKKADSGQIEQVLVNVVKNAIQACEQGSEVQILLSEKELIIRNNGKPISAEESNQLFNPFYSSKPDGQGIGLTLSREILVNHGFHFSLKTNEDGWTEFVIVF